MCVAGVGLALVRDLPPMGTRFPLDLHQSNRRRSNFQRGNILDLLLPVEMMEPPSQRAKPADQDW